LPALRLLATTGLLLGLAATLLGALAPVEPRLELVNHFRPLLALGAAGILGLGLAAGSRRLRLAAAGFLGLQLALLLAPLASRAEGADGALADAPAFRLVTANLLVANRDVEAVARFLEGERADVVVLQEADRMHRALIPRLAAAYPHAWCPDRACSQAILSREAPLEVGKEDLPPRRPLLVRARFQVGARTVEVIGTHLAYPFDPERQREHVTWLSGFLKGRPGPLVVAGDFNLAPFSWGLTRLVRDAGLRRHVTYGASWPAHRLLPLVLIDNVLSTSDVATRAVRIGPRIGSDHLPVTADLVLR
jgi:endonuclease/exonuclease/phosphatase (EEP) superfamily protein YafD